MVFFYARWTLTAEHYVKISILITNPKPTMSMQLNEMGAWFFLRMREWGIGRVGKNSNWVEHQFWKNVLKFSWARKHQKRPLFPHVSLMRHRFTVPHDLDGKKRFWKPNWAFMQQQTNKKRFRVWTLHDFPCLAICSFHDFGFRVQNCSLSHFL